MKCQIQNFILYLKYFQIWYSVRHNDFNQRFFLLLPVFHIFFHPAEHSLNSLSIWEPMIGYGLNQARIHHSERIRHSLESLHSIFIGEVVSSIDDSDALLPVDSKLWAQDVDCSVTLYSIVYIPPMVLILDDNSEGAHVRSYFYYLICLRHLIRSRAVTKIVLFFSRKDLVFFMIAQHALSYHLI